MLKFDAAMGKPPVECKQENTKNNKTQNRQHTLFLLIWRHPIIYGGNIVYRTLYR